MNELGKKVNFWIGVALVIVTLLSIYLEQAVIAAVVLIMLAAVQLMWPSIQTNLNRRKEEDFLVICIGGEKGSGKSTAAKYFETECGYYCTYFAKALKAACGEVFELTPEMMEDQDLKESEFVVPKKLSPSKVVLLASAVAPFYPNKITPTQVSRMIKVGGCKSLYTPRQVMQFVGTELLRDCVHPDFHVLCTKKELEERHRSHGDTRFVIADNRFPNEREFVKEHYKGYTILIVDGTKEEEVGEDKHISENSLGNPEDMDYVVVNNKTDYRDFYSALIKCLISMHVKRVMGEKNV